MVTVMLLVCWGGGERLPRADILVVLVDQLRHALRQAVDRETIRNQNAVLLAAQRRRRGRRNRQ